jgi:AbrB family looped-hinge helix DNA binding protein
MGLFDAKSSSKGQITVPAEVRDLIGLKPGGRVQFRTHADGRVEIVAKKRSIKGLKGLFAKPQKPVDVDKAIATDVRRRNQPGGRA